MADIPRQVVTRGVVFGPLEVTQRLMDMNARLSALEAVVRPVKDEEVQGDVASDDHEMIDREIPGVTEEPPPPPPEFG